MQLYLEQQTPFTTLKEKHTQQSSSVVAELKLSHNNTNRCRSTMLALDLLLHLLYVKKPTNCDIFQ